MLLDLRCRILNTDLSVATVEETVAFLTGVNSSERNGKYICNVSVDDVMFARKQPQFQKLLNQALLTLPNSYQLSSEMHLEGYPKAERVGVVELMERCIAVSASQDNEKKISHFFLCLNDMGNGKNRELNLKEKIQKKLKEEYPDSIVAGIYGLNSLDELSGEEEKIRKNICESKADVIWIGLPSTLQEQWMAEHEGIFDGVMVGVDYGIRVFADMTGKGAGAKEPHRGPFYWLRYVYSRCRQMPKGYLRMNLAYIWLTDKKYIGKTLFWIPTIATIMTIFILSSQDGVASGETSQGLTERIFQWAFSDSEVVMKSQLAALEALDAIIRMLAHMGEYAFLSLTVGLAVTVNGFRAKIRMFYMCFIGGLVAVCDEFYQIFVPGRYGDLYDVFCDCMGVLTVAVVWYLLGKQWTERKKDTNTTSFDGRRKFLNICLDDITFEQAVKEIGRLAKSEGKHYVVTPNVDHVIKIEKDLEFRKVYEEADLILTDGTPLMWIAESLGCPIKEKIPGADMLVPVCKMAAEEGISVFLFGATQTSLLRAGKNLKNKFPNLKIVGTYAPPMNFEKDSKEVEKAIQKINEKAPQILVVALGAPKQEKFVYRYRDQMEFHVALSFGAAIDFEAGMVKRAPLWIRKLGLEWLFRFFQEPGRLFRRYFIEDMKIFWLAWKYRHEIIRLKKEQ